MKERPEMNPDKRCGTCKYWTLLGQFKGDRFSHGQCDWPNPFWLVQTKGNAVGTGEDDGQSCPCWTEKR